MLKSLLFSLKQFIIKIATVVMAFLILMWVLLSFSFSFDYVGTGSESSMMAFFCAASDICFIRWASRVGRLRSRRVSGLIAKESVAGMLSLFYGAELSSAMSVPSA